MKVFVSSRIRAVVSNYSPNEPLSLSLSLFLSARPSSRASRLEPIFVEPVSNKGNNRNNASQQEKQEKKEKENARRGSRSVIKNSITIAPQEIVIIGYEWKRCLSGSVARGIKAQRAVRPTEISFGALSPVRIRVQ